MVEVQKLQFLRFFDIPARPSAEIGVVEAQKLELFFAFLDMPARPSAEIGVVEVQNSRFFKNFVVFDIPATLCGDGVVEVQKLEVFCVFDIPG